MDIKFEFFLNNMSTPLFKTNTILDALKIFKEDKTDVIPIIDELFNLIGILKLDSIFDCLMKQIDTSTVLYMLMDKNFHYIDKDNYFEVIDNIDFSYYPAVSKNKFIGLINVGLIKNYINNVNSISKYTRGKDGEPKKLEKSTRDIIDRMNIPLVLYSEKLGYISNHSFNEIFKLDNFLEYIKNAKNMDHITFTYNNNLMGIHPIHFNFLSQDITLYLIKKSECSNNYNLDLRKEVILPETIKEIERKIIIDTLIHFKGNKVKTAKHLGISISSLYYKLNNMKIPAIRKRNKS